MFRVLRWLIRRQLTPPTYIVLFWFGMCLEAQKLVKEPEIPSAHDPGKSIVRGGK